MIKKIILTSFLTTVIIITFIFFATEILPECGELSQIEPTKTDPSSNTTQSPSFTSPFLSKIGATLSLLLTGREGKQIPREMREIVMTDTVRVSIRFTHELNASEVQSIEELGLEFKRLSNGEVAHSGTIYGAEVPWDRVDDLTELESVVRIESGWQSGIEDPPVGQDKGKHGKGGEK